MSKDTTIVRLQGAETQSDCGSYVAVSERKRVKQVNSTIKLYHVLHGRIFLIIS